jgi:outer membrane protein assembly factor BamB
MILHQSKSIVKRVEKDSKNAAGAFEDNFVIKGFTKLDGDNYLIMAESSLDSTKFNAHLDIDIITYTRKDAQFFSVNITDGKLNWSTRVPKDQENKTGKGLGYSCKVVDDKLYVLFNDNFANTEKEWTPEVGVAKFDKMDNPIVLVAINMANPTSMAKREKLWTSEKTGSYFEEYNFLSLDASSEGILYLDDEVGKEQFARMVFK